MHIAFQIYDYNHVVIIELHNGADDDLIAAIWWPPFKPWKHIILKKNQFTLAVTFSFHIMTVFSPILLCILNAGLGFANLTRKPADIERHLWSLEWCWKTFFSLHTTCKQHYLYLKAIGRTEHEDPHQSKVQSLQWYVQGTQLATRLHWIVLRAKLRARVYTLSTVRHTVGQSSTELY